jgi:hypothetical protein
MHPEEVPTTRLLPGQVGYIACNMKQSSEGRILHNMYINISLTEGLQLILEIHYIVSGNLSSPCLAFNPPRLWYVHSPQNECASAHRHMPTGFRRHVSS